MRYVKDEDLQKRYADCVPGIQRGQLAAEIQRRQNFDNSSRAKFEEFNNSELQDFANGCYKDIRELKSTMFKGFDAIELTAIMTLKDYNTLAKLKHQAQTEIYRRMQR